ncbi:hypothetical protein TMatcc_009403 [Talaromyces marneffei ATCC 18224]|uniref:Myb-like domain-containing protein n=1 Tax=Talaromyces marneffei (strain ATCC 18224 / CBS 334.59 / QM 7333) TaxID=441960 RepID=B6QS92_TALMQ|nr:hypothetical protein PMAA_000780 [Talaromyces marneffei ATCC 18224]
MAYISLDNVVEYEYPKPKKPSKLPLIPCGASSFQSTTEPFLNRSPSIAVCATVVPPTSATENPSFLANINSVATQTQFQIEESCPPPSATIVDSDRSDEKDKNNDQNICDQKIDQDACQRSNEQTHSNHYTEKNNGLSEPPEATERLLAEDATGTRFLEIGISPLLSDSEIERHDSAAPDTFIEEIPSTVLDDPIVSAVQSDTTGIDHISMSPVNTPTGDETCLDTLADKGRRRSVCQHSPIAEAAVAQSASTQPRQNRSQQGRNSSVRVPCKSLSVVVPRRPLQSSKLSHTTRQSRRSRFIPSTESDDSGDSDYHEYSHAKSRIEDDEPAARPTKRKRRVDADMETSQLHRKRVYAQADPTSSPPRLASPESMIQSSISPETIRIQGQFLRKVSLSRVEYCCWVTEDINSTTSNLASSDILASFKRLADEGRQSTGMSDFQAIDIEGLFTRELKPCGYIWSFNFKEKHTKSLDHHTSSQQGRLSPSPDSFEEDEQVSQRIDESAKSVSSKGKEYTAEEDELIVTLKEIEKLPWSVISAYFPGRTKATLQVRYCTVLKKHKKRKASQTKGAEAVSKQNTESSGRQYSLRQSRRSPERYVPGS